MNIDLGKVSYVHMGFLLNYIVMQDESIVKPDKPSNIYSNIKEHPGFIQISHSTFINYADIDSVTSISVCMCSGKIFGYGERYRKSAIEKYMEIYAENIWRDVLRD